MNSTRMLLPLASPLFPTYASTRSSRALPEELSSEDEIAQRFTLALTVEHTISDDLYAEALKQFGEKGLVDLVVLAGCYDLVCGILNVFAVPAPDPNRLSAKV